MKILITGAAGFIGFHTAKALLDKKTTVIGLDNINDYYDPKLKFDRLKELGIHKKDAENFNKKSESESYSNFSFIRLNLEDKDALLSLFKKEKIDTVCHLAAQAGIRYSLINPDAYIQSNITGFFNILECCRHFKIKHLLYASSSSVYGLNKEIPFKVTANVDQPISLYAASKKSNELMAHTYSHLFNFKTTGLRFFTVYGPWGRPDMALFSFTKNIFAKKSIQVYNKGRMERDFTYIDDIISGVTKIIAHPDKQLATYQVYNIGNNKPVKLTQFIKTIETTLNIKAIKELLPIQPGDVEKTWADISAITNDFDYQPKTSVEEGVASFIDWYKNYYV